MSFEALPNKLLVKIFSHSSSYELRDLSLVNRRWNQVIGELATLKLCGNIHPSEEVICIPLEVLSGSSRKYNKFSCYLCSSDLQMLSGSFGAVLDYCRQRNWKMNTLHITSCYHQFILFLHHYKDLLNGVIRANISVTNCPENYHSARKRFKGSAQLAQLILRMEKLRHLNLVYKASSFCSLSLRAPELEFLEVIRCVIANKIHLTFHDSTNLHSVVMCKYGNVRCVDDVIVSKFDPIELQSALLKAPKITRLEITGCLISTTFSAMFGKLQTIILRSVIITPTDDPLECLHLTKLQLLNVSLQNPLKIRVPQLHTLICDNEALELLHLQDTFKADLLAVDLRYDKWYSTTAVSFHERFNSFRRLHLLLWYTSDDSRTNENDNHRRSWLWSYLTGFTELTLQTNCWDRCFHHLKNAWKYLPQLKSLRLLGMELPEIFNFLPSAVQNITIKDCSFFGSTIEFPPTVERVHIKKLWKLNEDVISSSAGIILLPLNRFAPLESEIVPVQELNKQMGSRTAYSSKDWLEADDMENVFPLRSRRVVQRRNFAYNEQYYTMDPKGEDVEVPKNL